DGPTSQIRQHPTRDGVVITVGQHVYAVMGELPGGKQQLLHVGKQRLVVPDDLQLDDVGLERAACKLCHEHGQLRRVASGRVRKQAVAAAQKQVQEAFLRGVAQVYTPYRDRHQLGSRRLQRIQHQLRIRIAARAHQ